MKKTANLIVEYDKDLETVWFWKDGNILAGANFSDITKDMKSELSRFFGRKLRFA